MPVRPAEHSLSCTDPAAPPGHPLRRLRALHGWSYETVARIVALRARELGVASMAAQRQKVWRWENRGVTPDRISQLALARELGVPDGEVAAHPWPAWLPEFDAPTCVQQIATLRGILEQVREVLGTGDHATATALVEEGLTIPVDEMVVNTALVRGAAVRAAVVRTVRPLARPAGAPRGASMPTGGRTMPTSGRAPTVGGRAMPTSGRAMPGRVTTVEPVRSEWSAATRAPAAAAGRLRTGEMR